jgi:hypothetical protein
MKKDEAKQLADTGDQSVAGRTQGWTQREADEVSQCDESLPQLLMDQQSADRNAESRGNAGCGISTLAEAGTIRSKR